MAQKNAVDNDAGAVSVDNSHDSTLATLQETNIDLLGSTVETHTEGYEGFDPLLHAVGKDGKPKMTVDGTFAKKRGRKPGTTVQLPDPGQMTDIAPAAGAPKVTRAVAEAAARNTANLLFNCCVFGISDEFAPSREEAGNMSMAFTDYFMERGVINLPPELVLLSAIAMYAAPRLQMPKTQAKIEKVRAFFGVNKNDKPVGQ